jgi:hypothetical protein
MRYQVQLWCDTSLLNRLQLEFVGCEHILSILVLPTSALDHLHPSDV